MGTQKQILGQLLGDGAGPASESPSFKILHQSMTNHLDVEAIVREEAAVFRGEEGRREMFWHLGQRGEIRVVLAEG